MNEATRTRIRRLGHRLRHRLDEAWGYWAPASLDALQPPAAEPEAPAEEPHRYIETDLRVLEEQGLLEVGDFTYHQFKVWAYERSGRVVIGRYCSIADDVEFMPGGNHNHRLVSTYPFRLLWNLPGAYEDGQPWSRGDIVVGNDVWIGRGARILSGVTIGDGAVVGAYAVVTRDVRPYAIASGMPAREIRRRFSDAQVEGLLATRWWDLPVEVVRELTPLLSSEDPDAFIARVAAMRGAAEPAEQLAPTA